MPLGTTGSFTGSGVAVDSTTGVSVGLSVGTGLRVDSGVGVAVLQPISSDTVEEV